MKKFFHNYFHFLTPSILVKCTMLEDAGIFQLQPIKCVTWKGSKHNGICDLLSKRTVNRKRD